MIILEQPTQPLPGVDDTLALRLDPADDLIPDPLGVGSENTIDLTPHADGST